MISVEILTLTLIVQLPVLISQFFYVSFVLQFYLNLCNIYFFVSIVYYVLLSALFFCCPSFSINLSCVLFQFCVELYFNMYINFFVYSLCIYCAEFTIYFSGFFYIPSVFELYLGLYIVICLRLFICM